MILCCGEALIDMIPVDLPDVGTTFAPHTGGAIFNTAVALGRLGAKAGMVSGVSRDAFGEQLVATLEANNVSTEHLIRSDLLTTLAIVHLKDGHATYGFYDEGCAGRMVQSSDMPTVPKDTSALYFGGISLVSAPAADAYADLCERVSTKLPVMIDPNIRPSFIVDVPAYRARMDRMFSHCDIVKVSDEDLAWITGDAGSLEAQAEVLRKRSPRFVIVTQGAEGALAFGPGETIHVAAQAASVVDTVGAGDTFNAGFLAQLQQDNMLKKATLNGLNAKDLSDALQYGARVAAVTVSRAGANPPWAHEL